ncbi:hypothetical protein PIB30_096413 [Stylosanthes scabra]|uniref:Uncharacterized protein n=1 Tax=Stylosanthes scabra TaxID=79078 RepID=A0ABU6QWT4_9FABA|nr:hypothetical protein [Stylosanthes scabra]
MSRLEQNDYEGRAVASPSEVEDVAENTPRSERGGLIRDWSSQLQSDVEKRRSKRVCHSLEDRSKEASLLRLIYGRIPVNRRKFDFIDLKTAYDFYNEQGEQEAKHLERNNRKMDLRPITHCGCDARAKVHVDHRTGRGPSSNQFDEKSGDTE